MLGLAQHVCFTCSVIFGIFKCTFFNSLRYWICFLKRSVGVSNFGVQHLREMEKAGLPMPAVNQIELHPFWRLDDIVNYCLEKGIAPMGYCPLFRGKKNDDPILIEIANRWVEGKKCMNKAWINEIFRLGTQRPVNTFKWLWVLACQMMLVPPLPFAWICVDVKVS